MPDAVQFCTFFVEDLFFGIEVEKVQEIIRFQPITSVPRAAYVIRGLMNLRGKIVTAIDLRRRMQLAEQLNPESSMNVVVNHDNDSVSLLVDKVGDVLTVDDELFEPPPETMASTARHLIRGAYKLDRQLMLVLELDRVLSLDG